ncbi:MAG: RNA polymerase sigma factor [Armatimonas sp.]
MKEVELTGDLNRLLEQERPVLLRFFQRRVELREYAEDLVQETLIEAWRQRHKVRGGRLSAAWVQGVARNVAMRGRRRHFIQRKRLVEPLAELPAPEEPLNQPLEQTELTDALDKALGLLSAPTRELLVGRYIDEIPISDLAGKLGITENALTVRLHRGRELLQSTLVSQFPETAIAYGLATEEDTRWQETRIWCANCGMHRLMGQLPEHGDGAFTLYCPGCQPNRCALFSYFAPDDGDREVLNVKGFGRLLKRADNACYSTYSPIMENGNGPCPHCGHSIQICHGKHGTRHGFSIFCPHCNTDLFHASLGRYQMGRPEFQEFWRRHPRLRRLPERELIFEGARAIEVSYESISQSATLTILCRADNLAVLKICN